MESRHVQNIFWATISDIDVGAKDRIKAAELIGKRYGMFKDGLAVEVEPVTLVNDLKE